MVNLLQMSNDGYSVILPRFGVQAGLLGLTLVLWLTARRRDERWASPREQAAGWGLAPALALPALSLLVMGYHLAIAFWQSR